VEGLLWELQLTGVVRTPQFLEVTGLTTAAGFSMDSIFSEDWESILTMAGRN
jgi:hypothetical protein